MIDFTAGLGVAFDRTWLIGSVRAMRLPTNDWTIDSGTQRPNKDIQHWRDTTKVCLLCSVSITQMRFLLPAP
jgi:hypothetical protein